MTTTFVSYRACEEYINRNGHGSGIVLVDRRKHVEVKLLSYRATVKMVLIAGKFRCMPSKVITDYYRGKNNVF